MNDVERFLRDTLANGVLDRQLQSQFVRWRRVWDYGDFRDAVLGRVWERRAEFRGTTQAEFVAWLRVLGWTIGVDRWRDEQRRRSLFQRIARRFKAPVSSSERVDTADLVEWLIAGLTDRERKLLLLKYFHFKTLDELALSLETSKAGVRQLHHRAIAKLRNRLGESENPALR
ncbi:MAG TPA: sigma-70 family RNA polymerase sigma factor [Gemmataceae bacterium]|jgi:RNA polymerase sigma factor (sigma-70 family)|nr:sigma-70 family RNA polymerase sigma factor [Gemmataceae bacterium]